MRIAVTGSHGVGKTTLIEDFASARPDYLMVPEPYWLMTEEGTHFAHGPASADLEQQLERSCTLLLSDAKQKNIVFDRCPVDYIAYLEVVGQAEGFEWFPTGKLLSRVEKALASLDLMVLIPLVRPDDIAITIEYRQLRSQVDARLKAIVRHDELGLFVEKPRVIEIFGTRDVRTNKLLAQAALGAKVPG